VDALLSRTTNVATEADYFTLTHLDDALMTEQEIRELPKVWVVGGDGALGDIGFQNVSKVILQNRPNVKMLMLDTQVYSNTGGQNSDSSTMLGGYEMSRKLSPAVTARPLSPKYRWLIQPSSLRRFWMDWRTAAPPSSKPTPRANPNTAWAII
jgi:hypothetical protein